MQEFNLDKVGKKAPKEPKIGTKSDVNKSRKALANEHEQELAEKLGGRRQINSGATERAKGDIKLARFLLDSKETISSQLLVSGPELSKITREARGEGKYPGLILTLKGISDTIGKEWVLLPLEVFGEILEELKASKK